MDAPAGALVGVTQFEFVMTEEEEGNSIGLS